MIATIIMAPLVTGFIALFMKRPAISRTLLISTALVHAAIVASFWWMRPASAFDGWIAVDAPGLLFLSIASALFLMASIYRVGIKPVEKGAEKRDFEEGFLFMSAPEGNFCGCLLLFLSMMTLVCVSRQMGLIWIAVEATTLASAPLIYFHRHKRSLEAAWKYLLICSVGIALALLGNFFLAMSAGRAVGHGSMVLEHLLEYGAAGILSPVWLKASFLMMLVGYGTKMGLAPLHTWLPDAHSESPSSVSALLSGALLNCSFLAILRAMQICDAAGQGAFCRDLLAGFGIFSMACAAVFIMGQRDYKRLLAYSSVEHVGILSLGVGLSGAGVFGAMFHAVNHSVTKAMMFLVAGNILTAFKTKTASDVGGLMRRLPLSGILWLLGFLAITGTPPFGTFLSEFIILKSALDQGRWVMASAYLTILALIFIGMGGVMLKMLQGKSSVQSSDSASSDRLPSILSPILLCAVVLILGLYMPPMLKNLLSEAARVMGGTF